MYTFQSGLTNQNTIMLLYMYEPFFLNPSTEYNVCKYSQELEQ
jgi:hypothetical protein